MIATRISSCGCVCVSAVTHFEPETSHVPEQRHSCVVWNITLLVSSPLMKQVCFLVKVSDFRRYSSNTGILEASK